MKLLVEQGANVDSRNDKEETLLERAAQHEFHDIARFSMERGASVFARDNEGRTAFHTASLWASSPRKVSAGLWRDVIGSGIFHGGV